MAEPPGRSASVARTRPGRRVVPALIAIGVVALVRWGPDLWDSIAASATGPERDSGGAVVERGATSAFAVREGDCFDIAGGATTSVDQVELVPCGEPHMFEAYASYVYSEGEGANYPGEHAIWAFSDEFCLEGFEAFVGRRYETSALDFAYLYPENEGWRQGDRTVLCIIQAVDQAPLTGTMEGSGV